MAERIHTRKAEKFYADKGGLESLALPIVKVDEALCARLIESSPIECRETKEQLARMYVIMKAHLEDLNNKLTAGILQVDESKQISGLCTNMRRTMEALKLLTEKPKSADDFL